MSLNAKWPAPSRQRHRPVPAAVPRPAIRGAVKAAVVAAVLSLLTVGCGVDVTNAGQGFTDPMVLSYAADADREFCATFYNDPIRLRCVTVARLRELIKAETTKAVRP